jgi:hypothetical protein
MLPFAIAELCALERSDGPVAAPTKALMKIIRDQTTPQEEAV